MGVLATRDVKEWSGPIDVGTWTTQAVGKWAWSSDVLGGLLALAQKRFEYDLNYRIKTDSTAYIVHCILPLSLSTPSILLLALLYSLLLGP